MNIGLPGTGIGGLFYVCSAIVLIFREILARYKGNKDTVRWNTARKEAYILFGAIVALLLFDWFLSVIIEIPISSGILPHTSYDGRILHAIPPIIIPILFLVIILGTMRVVAFFYGIKKRTS